MSSNKPFPSSDLDIFKENSLILDNFVNSQENEHPDRFGRKRPTITGIIKEAFNVRTDISNMNETLIGQSRWDVVPKNTSLSLGGDNGALNKQAQALFNRTEMLKVHSREALRRTYQEAGLVLVPGSFEDGGELNTIADVLLEEKTGKVYSWSGSFPKVVNKGTLPTSEAEFAIQSSKLLRQQLSTQALKLVNGRFALRDFVSLLDYGAVGDGVTDDTIAINKCLSDIKDGKNIIAPSGLTFAISSSLLIKHSNTTLSLPGSKIIPLEGRDLENTFDAITVGSGVVGSEIIENVTIRNVEIDGSNGGFDCGILGIGIKNSRFIGNHIHHTGNPLGSSVAERGFGILSRGRSADERNDNIFIQDNIIHDVGGVGNLRGDFIYTSFTSNQTITGNKCRNAPRMGIAVTSYTGNLIIHGNILSDINLAGIDLESNVKNNDIKQVEICDNIITRFGKKPNTGYIGGQFFGIDIHDTANKVIINNNIITDGDPDKVGNVTVAIAGINNAFDAIITGNYIASVSKIMTNWAGNSLKKIIFSNNICYANLAGIELALDPDITIMGNRIEVSNNGYPINIQTAFTGSSIISGNKLKTSGLCALKYHQSTNAIITSNMFEVGNLSAPDADTTSMVRIRNSGTGRYYFIIKDNIFLGNGDSKGIEFVALTGAVQKATTRDNIFNEGVTTRLVGAGSAQVDFGGVQVISPDGKQWIIKVDNAGVISAGLAT